MGLWVMSWSRNCPHCMSISVHISLWLERWLDSVRDCDTNLALGNSTSPSANLGVLTPVTHMRREGDRKLIYLVAQKWWCVHLRCCILPSPYLGGIMRWRATLIWPHSGRCSLLQEPSIVRKCDSWDGHWTFGRQVSAKSVDELVNWKNGRAKRPWSTVNMFLFDFWQSFKIELI